MKVTSSVILKDIYSRSVYNMMYTQAEIGTM